GLYDRFEVDDLIRPFFGRDMSGDRTRQKRFFAEWFGGPPSYSESAWGGLYRHHEDLPISAVVAERWLDHLRGAASDAVAGEVAVGNIVERARVVANALVNSNEAPARTKSGTTKHRSSQVASCGIGARTVKQANTLARRGKTDELASLVVELPDLVER